MRTESAIPFYVPMADKRLTTFALSRTHRLGAVPIADDSFEANVRAAPGEWTFELAFDGHRIVACRVERDVRLVSRELRDWSDTFPGVVRALQKLRARSVVIEGWLCALDARGLPSFERLRAHAAGQARPKLLFAAADLLHHDGEDLRAFALDERRARLRTLLADATAPLAVSGALPGDFDEIATLVRGDACLIARRGATVVSYPRALPERSLSPPPKVTNANKVIYPRDGITKQALVDFYASMSDVLLPYLEDRPVVGQRYPDGIDDFTWYQHRLPPKAPDYLRSIPYQGSRPGDRRFIIDDARGLAWLVNQAAITFHGWTSRASSLERPDWIALDLDPGPKTTWAQTIHVAIAVRKLLELLELPSVPKTSGQKGIHVLIPIAGHTIAEAHEASRRIAKVIAKTLPTLVTLEQAVEKRGGRLYLDYMQSYVGKTLVLPYSLRAADGAPVSTPLAWSEVDEKLDPKAFNMHSIRARIERVGDLAAPLLRGEARLDGALARLPA